MNRTISALTVLSGALWFAGLVCVLFAIGQQKAGWGPLGTLLTIAAATMNVRCFFNQLHERELVAFHLGRKSSGDVRPLR